MPYFPTYEEMQEALESARLKMWHEHGKTVDFGGPEFVLYAMEGLGKMEAPKILDEPIDQGTGEGVQGGDVEPTKVTVTKSFGVEAATSEGPKDEPEAEAVDDDGPVQAPEGDVGEGTHAFRSDRSGKRCIDCRKPRDEHHTELADG